MKKEYELTVKVANAKGGVIETIDEVLHEIAVEDVQWDRAARDGARWIVVVEAEDIAAVVAQVRTRIYQEVLHAVDLRFSAVRVVRQDFQAWAATDADWEAFRATYQCPDCGGALEGANRPPCYCGQRVAWTEVDGQQWTPALWFVSRQAAINFMEREADGWRLPTNMELHMVCKASQKMAEQIAYDPKGSNMQLLVAESDAGEPGECLACFVRAVPR